MKSRQEPIADESADDANHKVADKPKAAASHDLARKPSGHDADDEDRKNTVIGKSHGVSSRR
jgi:hypothetical protein